jgi:methylated-DNA-[protein]-cysteine S-methyltransferase
MSEIPRHGNSEETVSRGPLPPEPFRQYAAIMTTPWPAVKLGICADDEAILSIDFLSESAVDMDAMTPLAEEAQRQLRNYFLDPRRGFSLPIAPRGTSFQQKVWDALRRIPVGATSSYGAVARRLESSPRAVGGACRANPIPIIIPCHRVVAAQGIGGFMGARAGRGLSIKQSLLGHESSS